jgi:hypothetical protein
MKFDELVVELLEGTSPLRTLYHNTPFNYISEIIDSNVFICGENDEDFKDISRGEIPSIYEKYRYFMSAARTPNNSFARKDTEFSSIVSLELDASKLSDHGYIIKPINFFVSSKKKESEDRVLSKKKLINDFGQYIKTFHVYINPIEITKIMSITNINIKDMKKDSFNYKIKSILNTKKPAYVYNTRDEFHSMNRTKREPLSEKHILQ